METDLFRSTEVNGPTKACILICLLGDMPIVEKKPKYPVMIQARVSIADGTRQGFEFSPNAPVSKSAYQTYKVGATSSFADCVDRIFSGDMSTEEVVKAAYNEATIRYAKADISKFIEPSKDQDILNMQEKLKETAKILKEFDIYNIPEEMMNNLTETVKEVFGKKKQLTGKQATAEM